MIVAQQPAQPLAAMDGTGRTRKCETFRRNQPIVKALVIPFPVIMRHERRERSVQVGFTEDDDPIQAFLLDRADESLRVRIAVGRLNGVRTTRMPPSAKVRRNVGLHLVSRSQMKIRWPSSTPSSAAVSIRATWPMNASSGCGVDPMRCTRRDASSMTKSV